MCGFIIDFWLVVTMGFIYFFISFFFNFLIYYLFIIIIFLFLAVLGLRFFARAFSSCGEWGPLFIAVRGPLTIAASLVAEQRLQTLKLSSCGSRAQLLRGMWDLPRPGLEPVSPALAGRFSTTVPPGKPYFFFFNIFFKKINLFIYFIFLRWVFVAACGLSLVAASGGYSSLWCAGFSLRWLLSLWSTGFGRVGFSSYGTWAQLSWLVGSRAQAQ